MEWRCLWLAPIFLLDCNIDSGCDENKPSFYQIAKEKCQDIACIRSEINRINLGILKMLAERTAYVMRAGDIKSKTTQVADDRKRVMEQEQVIITESNKLGLSTAISIPTFRAIVENSILLQQKYIDQLMEEPPLLDNK